MDKEVMQMRVSRLDFTVCLSVCSCGFAAFTSEERILSNTLCWEANSDLYISCLASSFLMKKV